MNNKLLSMALDDRRAKGRAKKGLNAPELKAKETSVLGDGVKDCDLEGNASYSKGSTDDLAPSDKELKAKGIEMSDVDKSVFEESEYKKAKKKRKLNLFERMQLNLGEKYKKGEKEYE